MANKSYFNRRTIKFNQNFKHSLVKAILKIIYMTSNIFDNLFGEILKSIWLLHTTNLAFTHIINKKTLFFTNLYDFFET